MHKSLLPELKYRACILGVINWRWPHNISLLWKVPEGGWLHACWPQGGWDVHSVGHRSWRSCMREYKAEGSQAVGIRCDPRIQSGFRGALVQLGAEVNIFKHRSRGGGHTPAVFMPLNTTSFICRRLSPLCSHQLHWRQCLLCTSEKNRPFLYVPSCRFHGLTWSENVKFRSKPGFTYLPPSLQIQVVGIHCSVSAQSVIPWHPHLWKYSSLLQLHAALAMDSCPENHKSSVTITCFT